MKFRQMKQVVAGLALSAVMFGATTFEAHLVLAAAKADAALEMSPGIYRNATEMTETQRADLKWFQQQRLTLLKKQWQYEVNNGYMSEREMAARVIVMQERSQKTLSGNAPHKLSFEEKEAAKKFTKKYRKADKQAKKHMLAEKMSRDLAAGLITEKEYEARKIILQEHNKLNKSKRELSMVYKAQKAEFAKQAKELNQEYIKKCRANGSLTAAQAEKMLAALDNPNTLRTSKGKNDLESRLDQS